jgi:regulator of sigma E protease
MGSDLTSNPILAIVAFFVVLIPLILVHELGHFLAAKTVGITVLEFGIGFPPRIRKLFTWRETEFTLNAIPLGGFVRPLGEDMIRPVDEDTVEKDRQSLQARAGGSGFTGSTSKSVTDARPLGRIWFMAAGALANFVLAVVLYAVVALTGIPQNVGVGIGVIGVQSESPLAKAGLSPGDAITDVNGSKFSSVEEFLDRFQENRSNATITIQRLQATDQSAISLDLGVSAAELNSLSLSVLNYARILGTAEGSPAEQAGIQVGDIVTGFNGKPIESVRNFQNLTRENLGQEIQLTLLRGEQPIEVSLTPRTDPPEGQGAMGIMIGDVFAIDGLGLLYTPYDQQVIAPQSLGTSIAYGFSSVAEVINMTIRVPAELISGALRPEEARPVSVVGMSQIGGLVIQQSLDQGRLSPILGFIATISVALGFFNLLPIPALDGGRILFVLIEIVRGRPISPEREGMVHLVGLVLLLSLSALIILYDVINPVTNLLR